MARIKLIVPPGRLMPCTIDIDGRPLPDVKAIRIDAYTGKDGVEVKAFIEVLVTSLDVEVDVAEPHITKRVIGKRDNTP